VKNIAAMVFKNTLLGYYYYYYQFVMIKVIKKHGSQSFNFTQRKKQFS